MMHFPDAVKGVSFYCCGVSGTEGGDSVACWHLGGVWGVGVDICDKRRCSGCPEQQI